MTTHSWIQIIAAIGTLVAVPILYHGLVADHPSLSAIGFILFGASMLVTPVYKLKREVTATA